MAILKCNLYLKPLNIGNTNTLNIGDEIITIGSPMGQLNTVSKGIISNIDNSNSYIGITAPISPGSSGGVLLNSKGKAIGITSATYNSINSQNLNYAIDIQLLNNMYQNFKNNGTLGIPEDEQINKANSNGKITKEQYDAFVQKYGIQKLEKLMVNYLVKKSL